MADLKDQVAVVTGASGGIGASIACALADSGANLCLLGRDKSRLERTRAQIGEKSSDARIYICDLTSAKNIHRVAEEVTGSVPGIDILVHSAGCFLMKSLDETTEAEFDLQFSVNTRAPFLITKFLLPHIKMNKGQVVFLNSSASQQKSRAGLGAYTASKSALQSIADSLREEVNTSEVRVLSVFPGRTATPMQEDIFREEGREYEGSRLLQPEDIVRSVINALTMPRSAEVTDIHIRPFRKY
jgi:short-subunit dehydrogenase